MWQRTYKASKSKTIDFGVQTMKSLRKHYEVWRKERLKNESSAGVSRKTVSDDAAVTFCSTEWQYGHYSLSPSPRQPADSDPDSIESLQRRKIPIRFHSLQLQNRNRFIVHSNRFSLLRFSYACPVPPSKARSYGVSKTRLTMTHLAMNTRLIALAAFC